MQIKNNAAAANAIVTKLTADRPERGDFGHHISDLTACLRRRWIEHRSTNKGASPYALTFLRGSALHQLLSGATSKELELRRDGLIGTIDHIADNGSLWEWKTTMIWEGKLDDPSAWPESWLSQVMAYCFLAEIPSINVGILHLQGNGTTHRLASLRVYTLDFTEAELSQNWLNLRMRSQVVTADEEPAVGYRLGQFECKNCAFLGHCLPELKGLGDFPRTERDSMSLAEALNGSREVPLG